MGAGTFLAELRRRRVFRVVLAYCVAAAGTLQVAEIVTTHSRSPVWAMPVLLALAALGVVVSAVLAWIFDLTPRGIVRTVPGPTRVKPRTSRALF